MIPKWVSLCVIFCFGSELPAYVPPTPSSHHHFPTEQTLVFSCYKLSAARASGEEDRIWRSQLGVSAWVLMSSYHLLTDLRQGPLSYLSTTCLTWRSWTGSLTFWGSQRLWGKPWASCSWLQHPLLNFMDPPIPWSLSTDPLWSYSNQNLWPGPGVPYGLYCFWMACKLRMDFTFLKSH